MFCRRIGYFMFTTRQRSWEKVMFSVMSVCSWGSHGTITHDASDLTVQSSQHVALPLPPLTWDLIGQGTSLLVISSGYDWRPVQTCSLQAPSAEIWWLLKHIWSVQLGEGTHPNGFVFLYSVYFVVFCWACLTKCLMFILSSNSQPSTQTFCKQIFSV